MNILIDNALLHNVAGQFIRKLVIMFGIIATLCLASVANAQTSANHTAIWWNASESGWGLNLNQQGNTIFAAWYTYGTNNEPLWLFANAQKSDSGVFVGKVVRSTGVPLAQIVGNAIRSTVEIGDMRLTPNADGSMQFAYQLSLNGESIGADKRLTRFDFATPPICRSVTPGSNRIGARNYQDIWWNSQESGWGINFIHQDKTIFFAWYTYNEQGEPLWYSGTVNQVAGTERFEGAINRTRGRPLPLINGSPAVIGSAEEVGRASITFTDGERASLTYTIGSITQTKAITRFNFADPLTVCEPTGTVTPPPSSAALIQRAATFPAMPQDLVALITLRGTAVGTFGSGVPFNDLEYTIFDTDYIDGETSGYDTFMPVDPSLPFPGSDKIKIINAVANLDINLAYNAQDGDRIILGTAEIPTPFFARGSDNIDNDYVTITNFDYTNGHIQLRGSAADYGLVRCTTADGCKTDGFYLFYTVGEPDLIAFIFKCDNTALPVSGTQPQNPKSLCNASETLSLTDTNQFRFATPVSTKVALPSGQVQFGTSGKEVVGGITTDPAGNQYVIGLSDGNLDGATKADNEIFVARFNANGTPGWVRELALPEGSLLFDSVTDNEYLYAVGRTLGAIPGFTNKGRWDAIMLKIRLSDGVIVASDQFGNEGLDGYGNVVLDDAGNLYVSGAGSPAGATGTDNQHLVAKHRVSDLGNVWRQIVPPQVTTGQVLVAEAWGGLSYAPGSIPGQGKLVAGGWFMGSTDGGPNANGFLEVWTDLHLATPRRAASTVIASTGRQADWILDNAVDAAGNIYAVGFTTGGLQGAHRGNGDAYIVKYDANLQNPVFRQVGTPQSDAFRRMKIDSAGNIFAVGYTYGDYQGANADTSKRTGDVMVQKFDSALNPVTAIQFGTPHEDRGYMHLRSGTVYVGGMTEAALAGPSRGSFDGFVVKVDAQTMTLK
jgi:hypothetical protein